MTEEAKYQIFTETRGQYLIAKDKRYFQFFFPIDAMLTENIEVIQQLLTALLETEERLKKEKQEAEVVEAKVE